MKETLLTPKRVLITIGLPGCGKSTWMQRALTGTNFSILNADSIREEITGSAECFKQDALVWETLFNRLKIALRDDNIKYVGLDNTALTYRRRADIYNIVGEYIFEKMQESGFTITDERDVADISLIYFTPNVDVCIERQNQRDRRVPADVIRDMAKRIQEPTDKERSMIYNIITIEV